jgi:predicted Zn-dependent peptidase
MEKNSLSLSSTQKADYNFHELENGIKILSCFLPDRESVSVGVWVRVGSRYENKKIAGVSHFLEHIVFKGTKNRTASQIKRSIEGIGGSLNAFTSEEYTCYFVKLRAKYLSQAIDVLSDLVKNPVINSNDVEKEKLVILEEIKMYLDIPMHLVHELLNGLLWPKHPLGRFISGTLDTVSKISSSDIYKYWKDKYQSPNIVIVACGAVNHKKLVELTKRYFLNLSQGKKNKFFPVILNRKVKKGKDFLLKKKETQQAHFALGVYGLPRVHPQKYVLSLLHIILGANMSSRLFEEVREKRGLAYEIGTNIRRYIDTGAFVVHAGTDKTKVKKCIDVILKELSNLKKNIVGKNELERAKEYYLGQFLLMLEQTLEHMIWLGENFITTEKILKPQDIITEVKKVEEPQIKKLANVLFRNNKLNLSLIAPLEKEEFKEINKILYFK